MTRRDLIDATLARAVFERDGWRCCYCDCELLRETPVKGSPHELDEAWARGIETWKGGKWRQALRGYRATLEHKVPVSQGGTDAPDNLMASCRYCNQWRSDRPFKEARARLAEMMRDGTHPHVNEGTK